jgi:23S rRNA (cytosine1962-C5)-methyltransferase
MTEALARPVVTLLPGRHKRAATGHPWIYSNEVAMDAAAKALPPGSAVTLRTATGGAVGTALFNPHPLISARLLDRDPARPIDAAFLAARLRKAAALRDLLYPEPFYRLVHAEADLLPGLVVDRFGDVVVCQLNTAGMARLEAEIIAALETVLHPSAIVLRNDSPARLLEGLAEEPARIVKGEVTGPIELVENGTRFLADVLTGQKTGWFYDQRENRAFMARLSAGRRVLDVYSFGGGFALAALAGGASEALLVDRSEAALALAGQAAELNGMAPRCRFRRNEAFAEMQRLRDQGESFGTVIADPPAFIKSKKDVPAGLRGYRKMVRLAAALVEPGGFLFVASCSHNATPEDFAEAVRRGLEDAGRTGRILRAAGAAPDHPVHPALPESAYLKALALALD